MSDFEKIEYIQNYLKKKCDGQINFGKLVENEISGKVFDNNIINTLYNLSKGKLDIISPNYFQKINKDIAVFVFVIKDLLENIGLGSKYLKQDKEFILLSARLQENKMNLSKLYKIEENIC